ncbi:hypothetical protein HDU96_003756 [Phlyctochytrium bullatum]|nr:hypothetical protein HDU96_003756 [Phlyctochytrium bullatum]
MAFLTIEQLNEASAEVFLNTIEVLFEPAPPLAKALLEKRPFSSYESLLDTTEAIINSLSEEDRLIVINAHPRIGAPKEQLSAFSLKEQGYKSATAAASSEDAEVNALLSQLNDEYEKKFGFKFVVFVAGRPRSAIPPIIRERMQNPREQELATGLKAMIDIARDRLKKQQAQASL